jgi:hypothetical protein
MIISEKVSRFRPTISCLCARSKLRSKQAYFILIYNLILFFITDILGYAYLKFNDNVFFYLELYSVARVISELR